MKLLILDLDCQKAAQALGDVHLAKQINAVADIVCSVFPEELNAPRKPKNLKHPFVIWAKETRFNLLWLFGYGVALCSEYAYRFDEQHPAAGVIYWCKNNQRHITTIPWGFSCTEFPQVVPTWMKGDNAVQVYRTYYNLFKYPFVRWTKREAPIWWNHETDFGGKHG